MSNNIEASVNSTQDESSRMLTPAIIDRIVERVMNSISGDNKVTSIGIHGWWNSELKLSRNRVSLAGHRKDLRVSVTRLVNGATGTASTNQIDDISLKSVTEAAERYATIRNGRTLDSGLILESPQLDIPDMPIWSDATYTLPASEINDVIVMLANESEKEGMLAAGYLEVRAAEIARYSSGRTVTESYNKYTQAQCSMTVRHPQGVGSGWAGLSSYDWFKLDAKRLVEVSLDKCLRSLNPVAIEPGRYTVVMEPQAFADLFATLFSAFSDRNTAEGQPAHPLFLAGDPELRIGRSKIGLKIVDERINVYHDPMDPLLGVLPSRGMEKVKWIDKGVVQAIGNSRSYALSRQNLNNGDLWRLGYRIDGGAASIESMVNTTQRGLLVTRFWGIGVLDFRSVLATGVTRDGLWLIEDGKVSRAVKNMRFTESIMFSLNQLVELGEPVPVFRPVDNPYRTTGPTPAIVPPIKVNDFSFTSMIDAI